MLGDLTFHVAGQALPRLPDAPPLRPEPLLHSAVLGDRVRLTSIGPTAASLQPLRLRLQNVTESSRGNPTRIINANLRNSGLSREDTQGFSSWTRAKM